MHEIGPLHPRDLLAESGPKHRIVFLYIFSVTAHLWLDLIHSVKTRLCWEWLFRHLSCSHHSRTHHCITWTRYKSKLAVWNTPSVKPGVQGNTTINLESLIFLAVISRDMTNRHLSSHTPHQITNHSIRNTTVAGRGYAKNHLVGDHIARPSFESSVLLSNQSDTFESIETMCLYEQRAPKTDRCMLN